MSEAQRPAPQLPWDGRAERTDLFLMGAITVSVLYQLGTLVVTPSLIGSHPVLLELLSGSTAGIITMGAMARVGDASLWVAVLAAVPGLMVFDWIFWLAGRRWGKRSIDVFLGSHPKAVQRTARLERIIARYGWFAIVIAYFQPLPTVLIYAAAGWTRMRLRTFLILDLIGTLLWIGACVALGYAIGQSAVDIAKAISRYGLYLTGVLIVVVFARQMIVARRRLA